MWKSSWLVAALLATLCGCSGNAPGEFRAQSLDAPDEIPPPPDVETDAENDEERKPKTAIVRAVWETLDRIEIEEEGDIFEDVDRDELEEILLDADEELYHSLGDNPRQMILRANRKRQPFVVRPDRYIIKPKIVPAEPAPAEPVPAEELPIDDTDEG